MPDRRRLACGLVLSMLAGGVVAAGEIDRYLTGDLAELVQPATPIRLSAHRVTYPDGIVHPLSEKQGKVLLVNLWARWCVPCKDEMQDFASLQRDLGDDQFEVVALPMKKRSIASARKILGKWGAENLQPYGNDPQALARVLYDEGLFTEKEISFVYPTTYLVDKHGMILAIREGYFDWDTPEVRTLIEALKNEP